MITETETAFLAVVRAFLTEEKAALEELAALTEKQWNHLFVMAAQHSLLSAVYDVVGKTPEFAGLPGELRGQVKTQAMQSILQQVSRTALFLSDEKELEHLGVQPLVMKGIVCRSLYPKPDLRPSGDEDLLIPEKDAAIRVFRGRCVCTPAMAQLVGGRSQNFICPQLVSNLGRPTAFHAHGEDALHDRSRFQINKPMLRVLRVFYIAVRHIDRQRYATLSLGLLNGPNLAAGIAGVKLVEPVLNARKIVVYAVRVNGVVIVVNGNVANAILGKGKVCVQTRQGRVAPQSGQVFRDND